MEENGPILNNLEIDQDGSNQLLETARWAKLFSVLGLSALVLMILSFTIAWDTILKSLTEPSGGNPPPGTGPILFVILIVFIGIFSVLLLFILNGATRIRKGILNKDQILLNSGLSSLKNFFVMLGVITVLRFIFFLMGLL